MKKKLAFLGLGTMGYPMAGHLADAGHDVTVYNRTKSVSDRWTACFAGDSATTPAAAAKNSEVVFACVGNDADVRSVVTGPDGAFAGMSADTVFVDHTTTSAKLARELHAAARNAGIDFVDAPVSGGQAGAENGTLTIMIGGDPSPVDRVLPLLDAYALRARRIGDSGAGQLAKMVNQVCIAGLVQGLAEGLHFARAVGLDAAAVVDVISKGAAQSWQMDNRAGTMLEGEFDFGFAVDWMRKDLGYVLDEARESGAHLPVTELVDRFYADVQSLGGRRWDTSSLIVPLEKKRNDA